MNKSKLSCLELYLIIDILSDGIENAKKTKNESAFNYDITRIRKLRNRVRKVYRDALLDRSYYEKKN